MVKPLRLKIMKGDFVTTYDLTMLRILSLALQFISIEGGAGVSISIALSRLEFGFRIALLDKWLH